MQYQILSQITILKQIRVFHINNLLKHTHVLLTQLYEHCVTPTYFSPQRAIYREYNRHISTAGSTKWFTRCKTQFTSYSLRGILHLVIHFNYQPTNVLTQNFTLKQSKSLLHVSILRSSSSSYFVPVKVILKAFTK